MFVAKFFNGNAILNYIWAVNIVTFSITFSLFFGYHSNERFVFYDVEQIPTLSLTGAYMPEQLVLTSGLHILAFISLYFFCVVWRVYNFKIQRMLVEAAESPARVEGSSAVMLNTVQKCCSNAWTCCIKGAAPYTPWELQGINDGLWRVGLFFSTCMFLVGSVPTSVSYQFHGVLAVLMFLAGIIHVLTFTFTISKCIQLTYLPFFSSCKSDGASTSTACIGGLKNRQKYWHLACSALAVPINFAQLFVAIIVFETCDSLGCRKFSVQDVVVSEYIVAIAFLLYIEGFRSDEFQNTHLTTFFTETPETGESVSDRVTGEMGGRDRRNETSTSSDSAQAQIEFMEVDSPLPHDQPPPPVRAI